MNWFKQTYLISRNHYLLYALFLLVLLETSTICDAQVDLSHFSYYEHYSQDNGLPSTYISDIKEDKYGFLWIATANGVSRFDGNYFTNYSFFINDSVKQKIGFVRSIEMDISGEHFWIGTEKGIFYTSVDTIKFQNINKLNQSVNTSAIKSNDLLLDEQNMLWTANSNNGLWSIDIKENQQKGYFFESDLHQWNTKLNSLQCIVNDPNENILWIGSLAGLIRFNTMSKDYQVYVYENLPELAQNNIRGYSGFKFTGRGFSWNMEKGLVIFNKKTKQFNQPLIKNIQTHSTLILNIYNTRTK